MLSAQNMVKEEHLPVQELSLHLPYFPLSFVRSYFSQGSSSCISQTYSPFSPSS